MRRRERQDPCKHASPSGTWGQPWSPRRGFVYDEETRFATEVRCLICGATLEPTRADGKEQA